MQRNALRYRESEPDAETALKLGSARAETGDATKHVVLVTGDAPYLGGPSTWRPLREAAPELRFLELDLLDVPRDGDVIDAIRQKLREALLDARAVVAHGTVATVAIEAIASVNPSIPLLLLSPRIITRQSLALRIVRGLVASPAGKALLTAFARSKRKRLLVDESYVRKQMKMLVNDDVVSDTLVREAQMRIADPSMESITDRTAEVLTAILTPIDADTAASIASQRILAGSGPMDRRVRSQGNAIVIAQAKSAPMLEAPKAVAEELRSLLASS